MAFETFYLGTSTPSWLRQTNTPLFISRRRLARLKSLPIASGAWALDSGGFTELGMHGRWSISPRQYVDEVRRFTREIGNLQWAAVMDWMCEESILKKTGKTVEQHAELTVNSYRELQSLAPEIPWAPVLQGWTFGHYLDCAEVYEKCGIDLVKAPAVGFGSICRRNRLTPLLNVPLSEFHARGWKLHGFGLRSLNLQYLQLYFSTADSMAWSRQARFEPPLPGHTHTHCNNCLQYATQWHQDTMEKLRNQILNPDQTMTVMIHGVSA